ncbi:MAG: hypothetical protein JWO26_742 [Rhodospirillales bacterium]|nr:hypothetical protein [Rhodospirillales bacterium]
MPQIGATVEAADAEQVQVKRGGTFGTAFSGPGHAAAMALAAVMERTRPWMVCRMDPRTAAGIDVASRSCAASSIHTATSPSKRLPVAVMLTPVPLARSTKPMAAAQIEVPPALTLSVPAVIASVGRPGV